MTSTPLVWLITGCSSGLGLSLANHAASQGHRVIATSRNPSKTPDAVSHVECQGGKWIPLDVTSPDLEDSVKQAESIFGHIDVLVNNAGYSVLGAVEDVSLLAAHEQMDANFYGPFRIMKAVLPGMRRRRSGTIMNISSAQGLCPSPMCGIYAASKHALEGLSESLSHEVAPFGIRVLIIELGAFRTSFSSAGSASYIEPSEAYAAGDHPVAQRFKQLKAYDGAAPGDPDKAARVMIEAVTGEGNAGAVIKKDGLLRVILGPDCWKRIDDKVDILRKTVDVQKEIAAGTNLDGIPRP